MSTTDIIAFVPHHTPSKSRIMALVQQPGGIVLEAIATVEYAVTATALCNLMMADEWTVQMSNVWPLGDHALVASLDAARTRLSLDDEKLNFITELPVHELPDLPAMSTIDWAASFRPRSCDGLSCDSCSGCQDGKCLDGTCECCSSDDVSCMCTALDVGPRWAAVLYESLLDMAGWLCDEGAEDVLWGRGIGSALPTALGWQSAEFYLRIADTCVALAQRLADGTPALPQTPAEAVMLVHAGYKARENRTGGDEVSQDGLDFLPEDDTVFDQDALWWPQLADETPWQDLFDEDARCTPGSLEWIFEPLPD